jgi:hypothetical protein
MCYVLTNDVCLQGRGEMFTYFLVGEDSIQRLRRISSERQTHLDPPTPKLTPAGQPPSDGDSGGGSLHHENHPSISGGTGSSNLTGPTDCVSRSPGVTCSDDGRGSGSSRHSCHSRCTHRRRNSDSGSNTSGASSSSMSWVTWRDDATTNNDVTIDIDFGLDDAGDDVDNDLINNDMVERERRHLNFRRRGRRASSVGARDFARLFTSGKNDSDLSTSAMIPLLDWHRIREAAPAV